MGCQVTCSGRLLRHRPCTLLLCVVLLGGARAASAQELDMVVTAASGTGVSLGGGGGTVTARRSPAFLELEVGLIFDGDRDWEWTPGIVMELEEQTSVGLNLSFKRLVRWRRFSFYAGLGVPFYFAPFTLLGVEVAGGAAYRIISSVSLVLELRSDVFFVGSDLPDGSVVSKMDAALGFRVYL